MAFGANYRKILEINEEAKGMNSNKFEGNGIQFKCKIIGMEYLPIDRDERVCLESMFKLKVVVRARGEHKQKIQLILTMNGIKVVDELTKVEIAKHELVRISFVTMDPSDSRAFGYIYNTSDGRHQFWAIRTERSAVVTVLALKELFEIVYQRIKNSEKTETQTNQTISTSALPDTSTLSIQQSSSTSSPVVTSQPPIISAEPVPQPAQASKMPLFDDVWGDNPSTTVSQTMSTPKTPLFDNIWGGSPSTTVSQTTSTPKTPLFDNVWGDSPSTAIPRPLRTAQQLSTSNVDPWNISEPMLPTIQPTSRVEDSLANVFNVHTSSSTVTKTTQQSGSAIDTDDLFLVFTTSAPTPTVNTNVFAQPTQQTPFVSQQTPFVPQQAPFFPQQAPFVPQQHLNFQGSTSLTPSSPSIATNPFGDFSSKSPTAKTVLFTSNITN
ncbi:unnamed protein product [Rotaria sordida]|uniref:PID domain-containing protein n=1 Tax=Rotaria sordida TaxID=392033 RepID=A0A818FHN9_9BILA|nr:unnamed protein product [Rotaria sordida]CAF3944029.1 unnamed protein product [Rotaria sordida]